MKVRVLMFSLLICLLATTGASAQMGGGHMGGRMGGSHMGGGMGSGMSGAGDMITDMMGNTISNGCLDVIDPLRTPDDARAAMEAFINSSNSNLQISMIWEYGTVYKAELSDINGVMAFDLIADKFTGAVMPEMGLSMMLNASYGMGLYKASNFSKNLSLTPNQAKGQAETFIETNGLHYTLGTPLTYPGYYKFHTIDSNGDFGPEIMVNGYNAGVWMNSWLGIPIPKH